MDRLLEYISHHPWYAGGAALAAVVVIVYELRARSENVSSISPQEAVRLLNQGAFVIDLRPPEEFAGGHVSGARQMSGDQILKAGDTLKKQKEKVVVVYDDTGSLGASAVRQLAAQGFTKAFNLRGGLAAWRAENLPLQKLQGRGA
jgi:rhodanese-related sulfurtransferase